MHAPQYQNKSGWEKLISFYENSQREHLRSISATRRLMEFATIVFSIFAFLLHIANDTEQEAVAIPFLGLVVSPDFSYTFVTCVLSVMASVALATARRQISWQDALAKTGETWREYASAGQPCTLASSGKYFFVRLGALLVPSHFHLVFDSIYDHGIMWFSRLLHVVTAVVFWGVIFGTLWYSSYHSSHTTLALFDYPIAKIAFWTPAVFCAMLVVDLASD